MDIIIVSQNMTKNQINNQLNRIKEIIYDTGLFLHNHLASFIVTKPAEQYPLTHTIKLILENLQIGENVTTLTELARQFDLTTSTLKNILSRMRKQGYITTNGSSRKQQYIITRLK